MSLKTIFLDLGKVLVDFNYEVALSKIGQINGLSPEEIGRRINGHPDIPRYESGYMSTDEFFQGLSLTLDLDIPLSQFTEIWGSIFIFNGAAPSDLVSGQLFYQLKERYWLVALSNTNEMHFEHLSKVHPLIPEFDDYVLSYQVGALKPSPRIYEAALDKAQNSPTEVLFVDDLTENVRAAQEMGIEGIVFTGQLQLQNELQLLGAM